MREETFGPVLPVAPFDSDDEAIRLANDSEFGLAASVWTGDRRRGERMAARLKAGTVMVNDVISCFGIAEAPHGGFKFSGIGRTHGEMGMAEMVQVKHVDVDLLPSVPKPWWFGYDRKLKEQMDGFIDLLFARKWERRLVEHCAQWGWCGGAIGSERQDSIWLVLAWRWSVMDGTTVYVLLVIFVATLIRSVFRIWRGAHRCSSARPSPSGQRCSAAGRACFHYCRRRHHCAGLAQDPCGERGLARGFDALRHSTWPYLANQREPSPGQSGPSGHHHGLLAAMH